MKYLLDTNACIIFLRNSSEFAVARLKRERASDIALCSIVKSELLYGAERSTVPEQARLQVTAFCTPYASLPFDDQAAEVASQIRAFLARRGTPISSNDILIAAIALVNNLTLVTHNTREFQRVPNLRLEDWEAVA